MTWEHLLTLGSFLTAAISLIIALRKAPHESKALDGDAANKFATAAGMTADKNIELQKEMEEMEARLNKRINDVETENGQLQKEVKALRDENRDLREWAETLVCQVKELGGRPALIRSKQQGK